MSTELDSDCDPGWVTLACLQEDVDTARRKIEDLESALVHARMIGTAIGVLMTTMDLSEVDAFGVLTTRSHDESRATWQVAADVLDLP